MTPAVITLGFEAGHPCCLNGTRLEPLPLVRELNRLGGEHAIGRSDVVEDRLFGIKSREFYEAPAPTLLMTAHRDLQTLVHSRELIQLRKILSQRYAELVYVGLWFHDVRRALQGFFQQTQKFVTGEVRLKLYKGSCMVLGRRSPHSLYDSRLANQSNLEMFDNQWLQGFTSLWTLPSRLARASSRPSRALREDLATIPLYKWAAGGQPRWIVPGERILPREPVGRTRPALYTVSPTKVEAVFRFHVFCSSRIQVMDRIPMTREGYEKLKGRSRPYARTSRCSRSPSRIATAASDLGDLSENAEIITRPARIRAC